MHNLKNTLNSYTEHLSEETDSTITDLFVFPTSSAQQGLWLLDRLTGTTANYNIPWIHRINGKLNVGALKAALNEVIQRHEILRTYFTDQNGVPVQVIQSSFSIPLPVVDMREYSEELRTTELARIIQDNKTTAFNLEKLPLLQAQLLCLDDEEHIFVITFHHIISDGWSLDVFTREMSALYNTFSQGKASDLPELPIHYADYAVWQQEWLQDESMERLLDYWKIQLADIPTLELPTDRPRPTIPSFRGNIQSFNLSSNLTEGLKSLSRQEGVTLFMTLLAAFQVLLHRYSGQDDIVVGTPSAGRNRLELEDLIGFFVNSLVLRTDISGNPSFRELLAKVRNIALDAYDHQNMPFNKLVEALSPQHDPSRNPLFQVWFALQNTEHTKLQLNHLKVERLPVIEDGAKFDLAVYLKETSNGIEGYITYATDLFEATTIDRLIGHFQTLLEGILAHPEALLSDLPLLTEPEYHQILVEWNNTATEFPRNCYIHQLFEEQVIRSPNAVAVIHEDKQLTYNELNIRANQLAHYLRELGVKPDALVGICMGRSLDMVIGLLAILKAGGAYVPFDPTYPKERLLFMFEDSSPTALLTQERFTSLFADITKNVPVINLSAQSSAWTRYSETNPDHRSVGLTPNNIVNVLYTSGSTGQPKGVQALHSGIQNMLTWYIREFNLSCSDSILVTTSHSYDLTQRNIFGPLLVGARLLLASEPFYPEGIVTLIEKEHVSMMNLTPSSFHALINVNINGELSRLRRVVLGGEPVQASRLLELSEPRPEFVNGYGPTECTGIITYYRMPANLEQYSNRSVPIGRPIANTRIYILDTHQQPVPIGVVGEIYIGGAPVGRGYLNQPELTAERFITDPFTEEADARMYKTGDLGRWLSDGNIESIGRNDFQVKIRGFRIEMGEIETTLRQHTQLNEVVVGIYEPISGDKRLVAYLVSKSMPAPTPSELRDFLKSKLPEFMIPSAFVFLDTLPLTPSGKLNRKALPEPNPSQQTLNADFIAPCSPVEKQLSEIWAKVLKIDRIGIRDNFFDLGGHSLLAVNAVVMINQQLNINLPLGTLYQSPTIEELGILISSGNNQQSSWYSLAPVQTQGSRPPLFAIHTIKLADLPRYLGKDQPLYFLRYGMAAEGHDKSIRLPQLKELASHYIKEMQQLQPQGPYYMIGFSFGGVIAYEMACQLAANGHQVNFLGLLDTYLTREKLLLPFHRKFHKLFKLSPSQFVKRIERKINDIVKTNKYGTDFWPHFYTGAPDKACQMGYQPKKYDGQVTLFQGFEWDSVLSSYALPEQAWKTLLGDRLEVQQISGSHFDIFREPHVKVLAEKLIACIDKAINQQCSS